MANMASAARDIAATSGRDNLTVVAARNVRVTRAHHSQPLPTPPNSISPALRPHGLKAQLQRSTAKVELIDSDLDLQDDHAVLGTSTDDATGDITPAMLAKFHLPEILLDHGPLKIRHITGYLTTSVPGFAGIPPNKARRLVVGALEGKGSGGAGGGLDGDVEFEKVGWGRWSARKRGQSAHQDLARRGSSSSGSYAIGIPISKNAGRVIMVDRTRLMIGSDDDSAAYSHDDRDITMMEHEAEKMSMDDGGSGAASCSEAPDDDADMNDDPDDQTDDEDWAAIGAAALRASSYQPPGIQTSYSLLYNDPHMTVPGVDGMRSFSASVHGSGTPATASLNAFADFGRTTDAQEREAVEALLRLGSL